MQLHYCMGKLVEAGIWHHSQLDKCSSCGMKKKAGKKNNCCRDEQKKLTQVNDQKLAEQAYTALQAASVALPVQWTFQPAEHLFSAVVLTLFPMPLPRHCSAHLFAEQQFQNLIS